MDETLKAFFFLFALVVSLVAAVWDYVMNEPNRPTPLGLLCAAFAAFVTPFMVDAFEAS